MADQHRHHNNPASKSIKNDLMRDYWCRSTPSAGRHLPRLGTASVWLDPSSAIPVQIVRRIRWRQVGRGHRKRLSSSMEIAQLACEQMSIAKMNSFTLSQTRPMALITRSAASSSGHTDPRPELAGSGGRSIQESDQRNPIALRRGGADARLSSRLRGGELVANCQVWWQK